MKKHALLFLFIFPFFAFGQAWDYPVKPGTDEWRALETSSMMLKRSQIPNSLLQKLSTKKLVKLCLDYPLIGDMLFSNSGLQTGFEAVTSSFNGLQELFRRDDAGTELLLYYKEFDLNSFDKKRTVKNNVFFDICLDVVMSQPKFLEQLNHGQELELQRIALNRLKYRINSKGSLFQQKANAVLLSRLLFKQISDSKQPAYFKSDNYLMLNNYYIILDKSHIGSIMNETEKLLTKK